MLNRALKSLKLIKFAEKVPRFRWNNALDPEVDESVAAEYQLLNLTDKLIANQAKRTTNIGGTDRTTVDLQGVQVPVDELERIANEGLQLNSDLTNDRIRQVRPWYLGGAAAGAIGGGLLGRYAGAKLPKKALQAYDWLVGDKTKKREDSRRGKFWGTLIGGILGGSFGGDAAGNWFVDHRNTPPMRGGQEAARSVNLQLDQLRENMARAQHTDPNTPFDPKTLEPFKDPIDLDPIENAAKYALQRRYGA